MSKQSPFKLLLISACMLGAVQAMAQTPRQGEPGSGPRAQQAHRGYSGQPGEMGPRGFSKPSERVEARLAYQKTALKITDAQLPQWNAYAEHVRKVAKEMDQRMDEMRKRMTESRQRGEARQAQRPGAIEAMERRQAMHAEAIRRINDRLAVQKPLYAALSPDQQKIADAVLSPRGRQGMRGHGGMDGMGGRPGMGGQGGPMMRGEAHPMQMHGMGPEFTS